MVSFDTRVRKAVGKTLETKTYVTNKFYNDDWHKLVRTDVFKDIVVGAFGNNRVGNEIYVTHIRLAIRVSNPNDLTPCITRFLLMTDKNEYRALNDKFFESDQSSAPQEKDFVNTDPSNVEYIGYKINRNRYIKHNEWLVQTGQFQGDRPLIPGGPLVRQLNRPMVGGMYHQCKFVDIPINKKLTFDGSNAAYDPVIKLYHYHEKLLPNLENNQTYPPELSYQWWIHFKDA